MLFLNGLPRRGLLCSSVNGGVPILRRSLVARRHGRLLSSFVLSLVLDDLILSFHHDVEVVFFLDLFLRGERFFKSVLILSLIVGLGELALIVSVLFGIILLELNILVVGVVCVIRVGGGSLLLMLNLKRGWGLGLGSSPGSYSTTQLSGSIPKPRITSAPKRTLPALFK